MRYLGIDYGAARVGLAISDRDGTFAFPHGMYRNDARLISVIARVAREEQVGEIVVGDTLADTGGQNPISALSDSFAVALEQETGLPVHRVREAWSTREAARYAPRGKRHDDSAAAAIILQRFLDARKT
jgi:putative Holliday junction resolvase